MRTSQTNSSLKLIILAVLVLGLVAARAQDSTSSRDEIVHVLNRVTFGPCPGDVDNVQRMGLRAYLEQQLHPDSIDDSVAERDASGFELLEMSPQQLLGMYKQERMLQKMKNDAAKAEKAVGMTPAMPAATQDPMPTAPDASSPKQRMLDQMNAFRSVAAIGELQQAKLVRAIESKRQLQEVLVDFWGNHFNIDVKKNVDRILKVADDRDVIRPHIWGSFRDLLEASAKSPAMLVYLDNATNTKPRVPGPFEQRVRAMILAKMNETAADGTEAVTPPPPKNKKVGGINENYAREVMELHTLGVDGGYTQQDVQEVARCFTGWTVNQQDGGFIFRPKLHDNGAKVVLGHEIPAGGGIQDGERVLDILAAHPATAHHIALEMCQRFVSDDPPAALVDRIAGVFTQTGGDLRRVTEAILTSPEFLSPSDYNTKIKSPLEFAVSAVRASGSSIEAHYPGNLDKLMTTLEGAGTLGREKAIDRANKRPRQSLNWHIYDLGEPMFACTPPTGYTEVSSSWVSPGALIERLNFALALTEQKVSDVTFDPQTIFSGIDLDKPGAVLSRSVDVLLQGNVSDTTKKVLEQTVVPAPGDAKTINPSKLLALIIGSPEFQRK